MFSLSFTMNKRHLGILMCILGGATGLVVLGFDRLGLSDPQAGFGPSQQLGLVFAAASLLMGLSLIPLGNAPA